MPSDYLSDDLLILFKKQKIRTPKDYMFVFHNNGRPIKDLRKSWYKALEKAGIGKKLFHDLRRSAIRQMIRSGVSEHTAMSRSGHKTRSVFDRYDIVDLKDQKEAVAKQEAYLKRWKIEMVTKTVTPPKNPLFRPYKNRLTFAANLLIYHGAGGGGRTHTGARPTGF